MDLKTYIQAARGNGGALATKLEIPLSYLSQMASGNRAVSAERAAAIELHTEGRVTRQELRPEDWRTTWPELAAADAGAGA